MSCNSCLKSYSLLRPEKGCPGCGFSYCSKCIKNKLFLTKYNSEVKVCGKCKNGIESKPPSGIPPPDAYYKTGATQHNAPICSKDDSIEQEIKSRLEKLKDGSCSTQVTIGQPNHSLEKEIEERLKLLKDIPTTSQTELEQRLANIKGIPVNNKPTLPPINTKTDEEQANDLLKQYMDQNHIESQYKDEFDQTLHNIEERLQKLKGVDASKINIGIKNKETDDSEDEEETAKRIIDKAKCEMEMLDIEIDVPSNDELPFCEICNEDATVRCLGCKYLFCKRCFMEHKDDDDGCDKYETYKPPKGFKY
ncbi:abscission/NoCut checkpoint regulator isoform X2 [Leptidea sinapis]|uniref:abscission/NoCut checkpoint regulator isoform X2 n=1 Tax=Leptidea sinapis TaxID=189913 RepID=UPI0021C33C0F|nr:abscission/NoCut checkpoint regulator isoform X2 [Leptidea sinapis]